MATIDFSNFSFTAEQIRALNLLVWDDIVSAPEISMLCTIYPNIVFDKEIGFIGEGAPVGLARQGCEPIAQSWKVGTRTVTWEPKAWEVFIKECFTDLEATMAVYSLNTGVAIADFTDTDYMAIVQEALAREVKKFIIRLFWFNDKQAANIADGGLITDGINKDLFNLIDGFFKQMLIQITANTKQRVAITENAGLTYDDQVLDPVNVKGYLQKLVFSAPMALRYRPGQFIACTQSFYDAYAISLQGLSLESTYTNLINGQQTLTYNGVPLIPMQIWDEMIFRFENTGTRLNNPHRAVYVIKENLAVGVDGENSFEEVDVWYEKKERAVYTQLMGKADAKLLNPEMFQLAI